MRPSNSLRYRVAYTFAGFAALFSLLLAGSLYYTIDNFGDGLIDQALQAELDDSIQRHRQEAVFIPPFSASIIGFVKHVDTSDSGIPPALDGLPPGHHVVNFNETHFRALVADSDGLRYFMLFNMEQQYHREEQLLGYLLIAAVVLPLLAATGGFWLASGIVSPLSRLVTQVSAAGFDKVQLSSSKLERHDEVGDLARAIDHYLHRLQLFIERERNFTADISHELRTPLAVILGAIEVLEQDSNLSEKQKQRVVRIKRAVLETKELSGALLALAREPLASAEQQSYAVSDVLAECIEKHHYLIEGSPVGFNLEIRGNPRVGTERALLEVVIGNLIRNAFAYTQSGSVQVILEATRLRVIDTGMGMDQEELDQIFKPHYRGATSSGAGIGLSLVKRICERFGWGISMTSQPRQGTTAEVVFRSATI